MDSFALLKRRTTELFNSLPSVKSPTLPTFSNPLKGDPSIKATWEKIHGLPTLNRDGHSTDVVSGTVYIFGGGSGRDGNDNAMHAVILPSGSAQADYFAIQAKPAFVSSSAAPPPAAAPPAAAPTAHTTPVVPAARVVPRKEEETSEEDDDDEEDDGTDEDDDDEEDEDSDDDDDEEKPTKNKGKAKSMEEISLSSPPPAVASTSASASASKGKSPATDSVPPARRGHATAVIGHRIFLFGGTSPSSASGGTPLNEKGRVWVFDTRTSLWSFLDPVPAIQGSEIVLPEPRAGHVAVATTKPDKFQTFHSGQQHKTWREWALGETKKEEEEKGIPQAPVVGVISERARDADAEGYGTFIIHGGQGRKDTWSFDVHSRVWQRLPDAPFAASGKVALALSRSRLYRFAEDQLDFLELGVDSFDDFSAADEGEVVISARGQWKSLLKGKEDLGYKEADPAAKPLTEDENEEDWPGARSGASLEAVTVGGGREYLVLMFGARVGGGGQSKYWDDIWAFQVPAEGGSIASATDSILSAVGRKSGEGMWYRVKTSAYDDEDDVSAEGPGSRGYAASATMGDLEENGIVVWGGLGGGEGQAEKRLGDGWILRLG